MNSPRLRCCNYALVIDVSVLHFSPNGKACAWLHLVAIKVGGFETGAWLQAFGTARDAWQLHRQSLNGG